jgi:hypothetical protein
MVPCKRQVFVFFVFLVFFYNVIPTFYFILFIYFFIFLLLFICAYKAWFISPPCPHPLKGKFFMLIKFSMSVFFFLIFAFCILRNLCSLPGHRDFSSRGFTVSTFTSRSTILSHEIHLCLH